MNGLHIAITTERQHVNCTSRLNGTSSGSKLLPISKATRSTWREWGARYETAAIARNQDDLLELGQQIFAHFDGVDRWLSASLENTIGPVTFEICGNKAGDDLAEVLFGLPWEVLAWPDGQFLAADVYRLFHVVRRLGQGEAPAPALFRDLHMLFMAADVVGESDLDYMLEEAAIAKATQLARMNMLVEDSGELDMLGRRVTHLQSLQGMHLSCHGGQDKNGEPVLIVETTLGEPQTVRPTDLIHAFGEARPPFLFLSACMTGANTFGSYCALMIGGKTNTVLGWCGSVRDAHATRFAAEFYQSVANGNTITHAVAQARQKMFEADAHKVDPVDWHMARLFCGPNGGGVLVTKSGNKNPIPRQRADTAYDRQSKDYLDIDSGRVPVTPADLFVGRRRQLQACLRSIRSTDAVPPVGARILGIGQVGKSSLVAQLARRCHEFHPVVIYGDYSAKTICHQLAQAVPPGLRDNWMHLTLEQGSAAQTNNPNFLRAELEKLLTGPFADSGGIEHRPVLLILDDLEQILEHPTPDNQAAPVPFRIGHSAPIRAVLEAFASTRKETQSRLMITSRYDFSLPDATGHELRDCLTLVNVPHMRDRELAQQLRKAMWVAGHDLAGLTSAQREVINAALKAARGHPGLHAVLTRPLIDLGLEGLEAVEAATTDVLRWTADKATQVESKELERLLTRVALASYRCMLTNTQHDFLRACTLVEHPVSFEALYAIGRAAGIANAETALERLRSLSLVDSYATDRLTREAQVSPFVRADIQTLDVTEQSYLASEAGLAILASARAKVLSIPNFKARYGITAADFWENVELSNSLSLFEKLSLAATARDPGLSPLQIHELTRIFVEEAKKYRELVESGEITLGALFNSAIVLTSGEIGWALRIVNRMGDGIVPTGLIEKFSASTLECSDDVALALYQWEEENRDLGDSFIVILPCS